MTIGTIINSASIGDSSSFVVIDQLVGGLQGLPESPKNAGRLTLIVRRGEDGARETPERVEVTPEGGIPGDSWGRRGDKDPEKQIAVMESAVASMIANGQPLTLFGDGLFLDLDLSKENLPEGSRLQIGTAVLVVTPHPHNGCKKFLSRFGSDALRFVSTTEIRHRNLRGIYLRVVEGGTIATGDAITVVERP